LICPNRNGDVHIPGQEFHWQNIYIYSDEVLDVLDSPQPPDPSPDCEWCSYIGLKMRRTTRLTF